jgi:hypothetical protein
MTLEDKILISFAFLVINASCFTILHYDTLLGGAYFIFWLTMLCAYKLRNPALSEQKETGDK